VAAFLEAKDLRKRFPVRVAFGRHEALKAVDGVSFGLQKDSVLSLVGESGSGKSTVARLLLRLIQPTAGSVLFRGEDVFSLRGDGLKAFRKSVQIVFQDPFASLNPRKTVMDALSEPLKLHGLAKGGLLKEKAVELLKQVGLSESALGSYPHQFSGGQRQRVCIARALAVSPDVMVLDEPLSALDVSIQAQILNLLMELRGGSGMSYVFISHDLRVVEYISDEVAVMYLGKIVELSKAEELFGEPLHPYAVVLLSSVPDIEGGRARVVLKGEVPSPLHIPPGCPFHPRCPRRFEPCDKVVPLLLPYKGRPVSCHLWNPY